MKNNTKLLAQEWLSDVQRKGNISARDMSLLQRAADTLCANIVDDNGQNPWGSLRGIVPSTGRYKGVWNWDSAFHAMAVSRFDPELAYEQCEIFWQWQKENGLLIDVIRATGNMDNYSKPPVFPWAFMQVYRRSPNQNILERGYRVYSKNAEFWDNERYDDEFGLYYYSATRINDAWLTHQKWETGLDNSPRWDKGVDNWLAVDLNGFMVLFFHAMADMAEVLGIAPDVRKWQKREQDLKDNINRTLWNPQAGCYLDYDRRRHVFSDVLSSVCFVPLYAGCADRQQAESMATLAQDKNVFYPTMPTVAFSHADYDSADYWRGPTWLNFAYMAVAGLCRYGYKALAGEIREKVLSMADGEKRDIFEYYNSKTGEGLGASGFGWSSAFLIELILNPEVQ